MPYRQKKNQHYKAVQKGFIAIIAKYFKLIFGPV
jgi:hypothetical protein